MRSTRLSSLAAIAAAVLLAGCGNSIADVEKVGNVGVTVDDQGKPVVLVAPCREGRVRVDVSLGRTADMASTEKNQPVGNWTAAAASADPSELHLTDPGSGWEGDAVAAPAPEAMWVVTARFADDDETVLSGPTFDGKQLKGLSADDVLIAPADADSASTTVARADFNGGCS